jgi:transcriptional regulator with XRE-family HTH domain
VADLDSLVESDDGESSTTLGGKIRLARIERGYGVRELARVLKCSASLISQIERDKANPSVNTLYSIANVLGISVDSMFDTSDAQLSARKAANDDVVDTSPEKPRATPRSLAKLGSTVQNKKSRLAINLDHGVRWELLTPTPEHNNEFMEVTYPVGSSSAGNEEFVRHSGREYAVIIEGTLRAKIGTEDVVLGPGDSLAFDPTTPHRFWNDGVGAVRAVWFVQDRWTPGE